MASYAGMLLRGEGLLKGLCYAKFSQNSRVKGISTCEALFTILLMKCDNKISYYNA